MCEKIKKIPKIFWLFLLVLLIGSTGILYNWWPGNIGDEGGIIDITLRVFRDFSLSGKYAFRLPITILLYFPFAALTAAAYLIFGIGNFGQLKEMAIINSYKFLPYFRFANIIFGLITVYFFYKICLIVFKRQRPALIGAYLLASSLLFIQSIHMALAWMQQTMLIVIAIYYYLTLLDKKKISTFNYIISALLVVLSFGIEIVGLIVIVPFFLIYWRKRKEGAVRNEFFNLSLFFLIIIFGFALLIYANPTAFSVYLSLLLKSEKSGLGVTIYGQGITDRIFGFLKILSSFEPLLFLLAILGAIIAFKKEKFYFILFSSYFLIYYIVLGPIFGGVKEIRIFPLAPALAFFAALFIEFILDKYSNAAASKILYAALLIFMINPLIYDRFFLGKSSWIEASGWILKNIPVGSSILDKCWLGINENRAVLNFIREKTPYLFTTKRAYLLEHPYIIDSSKNYFVIMEKDIAEKIGMDKFQYLVLCYSANSEGKISEKEKWAAADYFRDRKKIKIYDSLAGHPLFKYFWFGHLANYSNWAKSGLFGLFNNVPYYGPHIEIYKLK